MFKRVALFLVGFILVAALLYTLDYKEFIEVTSRISLAWVEWR